MKVYISADIEGVTGTTHWNEANKGNPDFVEFREQMTAEVNAACEGALKSGATEIWVKDTHASARNIIAARLPHEAKLVRSWSDHPYAMVQEVDETFSAMLMIGYHSCAGSDANPLAHTISGSLSHIKINGDLVSEFRLNTYTAASVGVPVVFVSGDAGLCAEAASVVPGLVAVAVKEGIGNSTISIHPQIAIEQIRDGAQKAVGGNVSACRIEMPDSYRIEIRYKDHARAHKASFYPGAELMEPHVIQFESDSYFEVLRLLSFVV